jgi:hypothetical protein
MNEIPLRMPQFLPLHVLSVSAPRNSLGGAWREGNESSANMWSEDGTATCVVFVGFESSPMLKRYLESREARGLQLYSCDGQPQARVLDIKNWETSAGPEPWTQLLLNVSLTQALQFKTSDLFVMVEDAMEYAPLQALIQTR